MTERVGRQLRIYGRGQGVFFRQWSIDQARAHGVSGWVRNRPDGSVEAHLAGDEPAVSRMVEQMRQGPPQARIEDVTVEDVEPEHVEDFSVRL